MENLGQQVWSELLTRLAALSATNSRLEAELQQANARYLEAQAAEKAAKLSEHETSQLFQQLTSALPVVFWILESHSLKLLYVSPSFRDLTGLSPAELMKDITVWRTLVHPNDLHDFGERLQRLRTLEAMPDTERTFRIVRRPDQAVRHVRIIVFPINDENGLPYRRAAMLEDITDRHKAEQKLQQSIDLQNAIFANAQVGMVVTDRAGTYRAWNRYMEECTGIPSTSMIGAKVHLAPRVACWQAEGRERASMGEIFTAAPIALRHHQSGRELWVQVTYGPLRHADGRIEGVIGLLRDVTEQLRNEQTLRDSESLFRNLAESSPDGLLLTKGTTISYVNPTLLRITGYDTSEQLAGTDATLLLPAAEKLRMIPRITSFLASPDAQCPQPTELYLLRRDGGIVHVSGHCAHVRVNDWSATMTIIRDLTERDRAAVLANSLDREREHRAQTVQALQMVQDLSRRLANAQETESRRVARELHDDIGQLLTGLKLSLQRIQPSAVEDGDARTALRNAQELVGDIVERVRRLSLELRPTILDDLGLVPTLRWLTERFDRLMHIRVSLLQRGVDRRFPPELESTAYRIAQEALTNVARHAKVNEATVRIWSDGVLLGLQIEDHGQGFDPEGALSARQAAGLSGMIERARLLGGTCTVESRPGEGTLVTAELPLQPTPAEDLIEAQPASLRVLGGLENKGPSVP